MVQEVLEFESSDTSYTNNLCYGIIRKSSAKLFAAIFWLAVFNICIALMSLRMLQKFL